MASQSKGMTPKQQELFDKLTTLQKRVCTNILNGMTRPQAYKEAGGRAKGDAVNNVVSVMMMNVQVKTFMDEMYSYDMSQTVMTREEAMEILSGFSRAPNLNQRVRIQAVERLAKMQGWDAAQKHDLTGHILTSDVPLTDAQRAVLDKTLESDV
ncbi:hypothetical protein D3C85_343670 [compost metagenome]